MLDAETIKRIKEGFRTMTDAEHDAIMEELIRDGIMDHDGNVLVRMPEAPPAWLTQGNGHVAKPEPKPKKSRKRA
jgi:hypothetical protein